MIPLYRSKPLQLRSCWALGVGSSAETVQGARTVETHISLTPSHCARTTESFAGEAGVEKVKGFQQPLLSSAPTLTWACPRCMCRSQRGAGEGPQPANSCGTFCTGTFQLIPQRGLVLIYFHPGPMRIAGLSLVAATPVEI